MPRKQLFPGCWEDDKGAVHFDVGEIHEFLGCPPEKDTIAERIDTARKMKEILKSILPPGTEIIINDMPPDE